MMLNTFALHRQAQNMAFNSKKIGNKIGIFEFPANFLVSQEEEQQQQEQEQQQQTE